MHIVLLMTFEKSPNSARQPSGVSKPRLPDRTLQVIEHATEFNRTGLSAIEKELLAEDDEPTKMAVFLDELMKDRERRVAEKRSSQN